MLSYGATDIPTVAGYTVLNTALDAFGSKIGGINTPTGVFAYSLSGTLFESVTYIAVSQLRAYTQYEWFDSPTIAEAVAKAQMFDTAVNLSARTIAFFTGIVVGKAIARRYQHEISNRDILKLMAIKAVTGTILGIALSAIAESQLV